MNWGDSSIEKLIQKFCFQFHLVRKNCVQKMVPVFWYRFSVPVSGACVIGIRHEGVNNCFTVKPIILAALNFGSSVYEIILTPLILAFLLTALSNTQK